MREKILKALERATGQKGIHLEKPESEEYGDYASNIALAMFSNFQFPISPAKRDPALQDNFQLPIKNIRSSNDLAKMIVKELKRDKKLMEVVEEIEIAGPGFINFWLMRPGLASNITKILKDIDRYGSSEVGKGKTVLVEYSSPNIAKQFSVGHMRSTIIGQSLRNIYDFLGYKTIGENHFGDWGTQFGMIIAQIIRKNINQKNLKVSDYQKLYSIGNWKLSRRARSRFAGEIGNSALRNTLFVRAAVYCKYGPEFPSSKNTSSQLKSMSLLGLCIKS